MEKVLTIGVPVYNMEKYLDRCLSSITSIKRPDLCEIIVVNDGSKDRSLEIAKGYESKYPDLLRVIDKENGGWGSCINRTIHEASGKYYKSLDSDDWFDTINLDSFIEELKDEDADMILSPYWETDESGNLTVEKVFSPELYGQTLNLNDYIQSLGTFKKSIHAITFKTSILKDNGIHIWERFYGDIDYINSPLKFVETIRFSPYNIYRYMIGREGQSISVKGYRAHINDYIAVARKMIKSFGNPTNDTPVAKYLYDDTTKITTFAYKLMMQPGLCGKEEVINDLLKDFDKFLKTESPAIYKEVGRRTKKLGISPVSVWRVTSINIYKIFKV